jgi:hypothetical protein
MRYAQLIDADERVALHVAVDDAVAEQVGLDWMRCGAEHLTLEIVGDTGGVPETVAAEVLALLSSGIDEVVVVLGTLAMRGIGRRLLHDGSAAAICELVQCLSRTVIVVLPVPVAR